MIRHAEDDYTALTVANAMLRVGAEVISITDASGPPFASSIGRFIVWAKVRDKAHVAEVDASIDSSN
jgi:DNA-binding MurR/RpiR family transcriptional regulator